MEEEKGEKTPAVNKRRERWGNGRRERTTTDKNIPARPGKREIHTSPITEFFFFFGFLPQKRPDVFCTRKRGGEGKGSGHQGSVKDLKEDEG